MLPNTNAPIAASPFGFAQQHNLLAQQARPTGVMPMNPGSAGAPNFGQQLAAFQGGNVPAVQPTVDMSQWGTGNLAATSGPAAPGPEVNTPQPLPGVRPTGVMPMNPMPPVRVNGPRQVHPLQNAMINKLRGTGIQGRY